MTVSERRVELLREQNRQLTTLLVDPQLGLHTWMLAMETVRREINAILNGERD